LHWQATATFAKGANESIYVHDHGPQRHGDTESGSNYSLSRVFRGGLCLRAEWNENPPIRKSLNP